MENKNTSRLPINVNDGLLTELNDARTIIFNIEDILSMPKNIEQIKALRKFKGAVKSYTHKYRA